LGGVFILLFVFIGFIIYLYLFAVFFQEIRQISDAVVNEVVVQAGDQHAEDCMDKVLFFIYFCFIMLLYFVLLI
jgi:hypothetical protein